MTDVPDVPPSLSARAVSWTRYWRRGAMHSCGTSFDSNYGGGVRAFWSEAVSGLPLSACVLDLCTGNGPLPRLLLELQPDPAALAIVAVDLADVAPAWIEALAPAQRDRLRFLGGVRAEALPLDAQSIDVAISQFGIEYTDTDAVLVELRRVLRPHGRAAMIVHAGESLIVRQAREELAHAAWLRSGVLDAAAAMVEPMSRVATPAGRESLQRDPAANAARRDFNAALQALDMRARSSSCPDLLFEMQQGIAAALDVSARHGVQAGAAALDGVHADLADRELQLGELVQCARSQEAASALLHPLAPASLHVRDIRFDSGDLLGWGVVAKLSG